VEEPVGSESEGSLEIEWCHSKDLVQAMVSFFLENVDRSYISHGEIQEGRAVDVQTWSPELPQLLRGEFEACLEFRSMEDGACKAAVATRNGEISAVLILKLHRLRDVRFAVLSDLVVKKDCRGLGIGARVFSWLQGEVNKEGIRWIFLESGLQNQNAHRFFQSQGFEPCSIVMLKEIS
jgi:ribosomal protein S18 acetylase RimI-like enzyme